MCRLKQHGNGRALADLAFQLDAGVVDPGNVLDDASPRPVPPVALLRLLSTR